MSTRQEKVREFLKVEVSRIIQTRMRDPRLGFVTVTDAEVSKDLRHAKIFVSVLGSDEERDRSLATLQSAAGFIRGEFGKHSSMKVLPEISFRFDTSVEHGSRIFELLQQVKHGPDEPQGDRNS